MHRIKYESLNARQQEIYNFQKASAVFADFGYTTIKLSDDWMGADFIAISFDDSRHLMVQLKGRMTFEKKYVGKGLHICFFDRESESWYLYPHDEALQKFLGQIEGTKSWMPEDGGYSFPRLSEETKAKMEEYLLA